MPYAVRMTRDAKRDLEDIYEYIARHDMPAKADHVLDQLSHAVSSLAEQPSRGAFPKELNALGIQVYREVYFKHYRLIYQVMGEQVIIMLIADGRRDMQALLQRRLLGA